MIQISSITEVRLAVVEVVKQRSQRVTNGVAGLGPSTSVWSETGLGWMLYYK